MPVECEGTGMRYACADVGDACFTDFVKPAVLRVKPELPVDEKCFGAAISLLCNTHSNTMLITFLLGGDYHLVPKSWTH